MPHISSDLNRASGIQSARLAESAQQHIALEDSALLTVAASVELAVNRASRIPCLKGALHDWNILPLETVPPAATFIVNAAQSDVNVRPRKIVDLDPGIAIKTLTRPVSIATSEPVHTAPPVPIGLVPSAPPNATATVSSAITNTLSSSQ